jgi:hypothetical protein
MQAIVADGAQTAGPRAGMTCPSAYREIEEKAEVLASRPSEVRHLVLAED